MMRKSISPLLVSVFFLLKFGAAIAQGGGCVCTNCPQFMPDNFTGAFLINVQGAANNSLADPGQGVCGVTIHFDHEYIGDLSITLISPGGQAVTLVGPIGLWGETDGTTWDISFVPCADPAAPDAGFSDVFNNNQAWGLLGNYSGSYYPASGCLENFNTGPVNGTWTLNVIDGQPNDVGNFLDYEIIFCDGAGIACFSCAANAGNLLQPDVSACEGAASLNLNLPPTYVAPNIPPPPAEYDYTYVLSQNGIIIDFLPSPNLSGLDAGVYSICGMSYLTTAADDIPVPNGTLTVAQLTNQLNSTTAPFCGDITQNCVNITINDVPDNEMESAAICFGNCEVFHGQQFCNTGVYNLNLTTAQGCPFTATLNLTEWPEETTTIYETICDGECSATPGFGASCTSGTYTEKLTNPDSGCDSTVTLNLTVLTVNAVIQPPQPIGCATGTTVLNSTGSSTGGATYQWSGPGIVGPNTGPTCTVNQPGTYQLIVRKSAGGIVCADSASVIVTINNAVPIAPASVLGMQTVCPGQSLNYTTTTVSGATGYQWFLPAGATITAGQNTAAVTILWGNTGGNLCVAAVNSCGPGAQTCIPITLGSAPPAPAVSGNDTICSGTTGVFSVPNSPGSTAWNWTVPPGATIAAGQGTASISVNWGNSTGGPVCATVANDCGMGPQGCLNVLGLTAPAQPVVLGNNSACANSPQTYSVQNQPGSAYLWTVSAAGTIVSGQGTNQITVLWGATGNTGSVCISTQNECGNSPQACLSVALDHAPAQPDLAAVQPPCAGETFTFTVANVPDATGYNWTAPPGATIASGQGTATVSVLFSAPPGGQLCVAATNLCGQSPNDCEAVLVNAVPAPGAGANGQICGQTFNLTGNQSIPSSTASWTQAAGPGMAAFTNPASANTQVTVNQYGSYIFRYSESNGSCTVSDSVTVVFNGSPAAGLIVPACTPANLNYTITFPIIGGQGQWSVAGGTVIGGIFSSNLIASGAAYNFTITDANGCTSAAISGSFDCNCVTLSGQMSQTPLEACEGLTVTALAPPNAVLDANDIAAFFLHDNPGTSLGTIFDQNLTGIFGHKPGMVFGQTYYISYVVGNDLAGLPDPLDGCRSVAQGTPAVFYENPVAFAGLDRDTCGFTLIMSATPSVGFGTWSLSGGPVGGSLLFADIQNAATAVTASKSGPYNVSWAELNHGCLSSDVIVLTFNEKPTAAIPVVQCDATGQNFTVGFDLVGIAPFFVNGQILVGTTFNSAPMPSGTAYNFEFTDANGCPGTAISGIKNCNCLSESGTMPTATLTACIGMTVQAGLPTGALPDGNDIGAFVLQDLGTAALGTVLAINTTGEFGFLSGPMQPGQTYYISYVLGNNVGGLPDLMDGCLAVAAGQPVVFYPYPVANAGADQVLCGNKVDFSANQTGTGLWSVIAKPPGATVNFGNPGAGATSATVSTAGNFLFEWKIDQNGCADSDTLAVNFTSAPMATLLQKDCDASATQFTVSFKITGGTAPYTVAGLPGNLTGTDFLSSFLPNNSAFSATLTDATGCTSVLSGNHNCNCQTDAGQMSLANLSVCESDTAAAIFLGNENLDSDDTLFYALHDGNQAMLGTIFATSPMPVFAYSSTLVFGQTYFISAVATSVFGGQPNFNDGCISVAQGQPVVFRKNPTATMTSTVTEICNGQSANLNFQCTGDGPFTIFYGDGTDQFTLNIGLAGSFSQPVTPALSTVYTIFEINDSNQPACSALLGATVEIEVGQPASAIVTTAATACNNSLFGSIIDFSTLVNGGDLTGNWTDLGNSGAAGAFPELDFDGLAAGKYSFKYTTAAASQPCPQQTYLVEITITDCQCPSVATTAPVPLCNFGGELVLSTITVTSSPGVWTIANAPGGANPAVISNNVFYANAADAGIYSLDFALSPPPPLGCPLGSAQNLTVAPGVFAGKAQAPAGFCVGEDWQLALNSFLDSDPTAGGIWAEISQNPTVSGAFSAAQGSLFTKNLLPGTYKFRYKVTSTAPCLDDEEVVTVFIEQNPTADAGPDLELDCFTGSGKIGGAATTGGANISHFWEKDGQNILFANLPFLTVNQPGIYGLSAVSSPLGCKDSDEVLVTTAENPTSIAATPGEIPCFGQAVGSISVTAATGGQSPYLYGFNGGAFSSQSFWGGLTAGFYEIKTQDANGCERTDTVEVVAPAPFLVNLGADTLVRLGDSLTVFVEILPNQAAIDTLIWSPVLNVNQVGQPMQSFAPLHTWLLTLTAFDKNGCRAEDNILVEVDPERNVFVPNAFAPGSAGNGTFSIFAGKDVVKIKSLQVFDRWGEMLFENRDFHPNDPSIGWDGTRGGEKMLPGVYVWWAEILFLDGEIKIYKGDVMLAR